MELSLQPRYSYKKLYNKREEMIIKEGLHIQDAVTYVQFEALYKKYGYGLSEKDFAKYFLDIDYASYYKLQSKQGKTSIILEREFYLDEEFDEIRNQISKLGLKKKDRLNYEKLIELYNVYGRKFSLKMFAEKVLALNAHRVDYLNFNRESEALILNKEFEDKKVIRKIRENIVTNEKKLHINSQIKLSEFNELYQKYVLEQGIELNKKVFALNVLGISNDVYRRFENGKREKVIIFGTYPVNPEYIARLREDVITLEGLHIDDSISPRRFNELYEKYAGILTEELFVEEILDNSMDNVKSSRKRNHNINILNRIEIPEQYIEELQEKVKKENNLKYNQLKSLEEIRELYSKYGYILSEKQFVCLVLGVSDYNYYQLTNGTTKESYILVDNSERNYEEIRRKVIIENKLHYDDEINYNKLHNLHQKYEPKMREYIFANKILDINQRSLDNIRYDKKHKTHILLLEPLPSDDELLKLKENVISKYKLHRRDDIDYKRF